MIANIQTYLHDDLTLDLIKFSSSVCSDHPEIIVEDHLAEHSLASEQHGDVPVEREAPGQHDDVRTEPLDVLQELVLSPVVVGDVDDLDGHVADTGVQVVTAIRCRVPLDDLHNVWDLVWIIGKTVEARLEAGSNPSLLTIPDKEFVSLVDVTPVLQSERRLSV